MSVDDALTSIEERSQSDSDYAGEPSALVPLLVAVARAAECLDLEDATNWRTCAALGHPLCPVCAALAAVERYANEHLPGGA